MARLSYLELPVGDLAAARAFYERAFGWAFTDYGPGYSATTSGDTDVGLAADPEDATEHLLPVVEVADLESVLAAVQQAGGTVTRPIFGFPGGRRFHFRDPAGHELAAMQPDGA